MNTAHEHHIQALVAQGNDEQIVRLIDALLALDQEHAEARVDLLLQLGKCYLVLALSREHVSVEAESEEALLNMLQKSPVFTSSGPHDSFALDWYKEALDYFTAAINQAPSTYDISFAIAYRDLAQAFEQRAHDGVQERTSTSQ